MTRLTFCGRWYNDNNNNNVFISANLSHKNRAQRPVLKMLIKTVHAETPQADKDNSNVYSKHIYANTLAHTNACLQQMNSFI